MSSYIKLNKVAISDLNLNEDFVQKFIAENPASIGLGDLKLIERERIQSSGGRLDLLLQDSDSAKRYEVEIQLGKTDPSHIIRTLEYWDIERKLFPQFEHCAVIIAEEITNRFFNVISLFNGFIPIVAIQMNAYKLENEDKYCLIFTKILDQSSLVSLIEEPKQELVDEKWWETHSPNSLDLAKAIIDILNAERQDKLKLNFVKSYISIKKDDRGGNLIAILPSKKDSPVGVNIHLSKSDDTTNYLSKNEIKTLDYDNVYHNYRLKLKKEDLNSDSVKKAIMELFKRAENEYNE